MNPQTLVRALFPGPLDIVGDTPSRQGASPPRAPPDFRLLSLRQLTSLGGGRMP